MHSAMGGGSTQNMWLDLTLHPPDGGIEADAGPGCQLGDDDDGPGVGAGGHIHAVARGGLHADAGVLKEEEVGGGEGDHGGRGQHSRNAASVTAGHNNDRRHLSYNHQLLIRVVTIPYQLLGVSTAVVIKAACAPHEDRWTGLR